MTYPLRQPPPVEEDRVVETVRRWCGKCMQETDWARNPDDLDRRMRCLNFRNGDHCFYDNLAPLTEQEAQALAAHVREDMVRPYFYV